MTAIPAGTWVEIEQTVLEPGERAPGIPDDTRAVPLLLRVSGFLVEPVEVGGPASVRTIIGRTLSGTLRTVNPGYSHSFGETVQELLTIGTEFEP